MKASKPLTRPTDEEVKAAVRAEASQSGSIPREFWQRATPIQRMMALELRRQIHYGDDESTSPKFEYVMRVRDLKDQADE
jgi:hypothetical protein